MARIRLFLVPPALLVLSGLLVLTVLQGQPQRFLDRPAQRERLDLLGHEVCLEVTPLFLARKDLKECRDLPG